MSSCSIVHHDTEEKWCRHINIVSTDEFPASPNKAALPNWIQVPTGHWWAFSFLFPLVIIFILFRSLVMTFIYFSMMIFQIFMIYVAIPNITLNAFATSSLLYSYSSMVFHRKCNHIIRLKFAMLNNSKIFQEKGRHKSSAAQRLRHNHCPFALYKTLRF